MKIEGGKIKYKNEQREYELPIDSMEFEHVNEDEQGNLMAGTGGIIMYNHDDPIHHVFVVGETVNYIAPNSVPKKYNGDYKVVKVYGSCKYVMKYNGPHADK